MSNVLFWGEDWFIFVVVMIFCCIEFLFVLVVVICVGVGESGQYMCIVLVDNDFECLVEMFVVELGVDYVVESILGIVVVCQVVFDVVFDGEFVVMVDDDVFFQFGWLDVLVDVWEDMGYFVVVMGYVEYVWLEGMDFWVVVGGFMRW